MHLKLFCYFIVVIAVVAALVKRCSLIVVVLNSFGKKNITRETTSGQQLSPMDTLALSHPYAKKVIVKSHVRVRCGSGR